MKVFLSGFLLYLFCVTILGSTSREDLNLELRREMGLESPGKTVPKEDPNSPEEPNPVRERYANTEGEGGSLLWILVKIFFALAILSAIFYYLLRILSRNREARYPVKGFMRVLSSLPIASGKEIILVEIAGSILTLGVSENSIQFLKEIENPDTKDKILQARETAEPPEENFLQVLMKNFKDKDQAKFFKKEVEKEAPEEEIVEEIKNRQIERLEKIRQERQNIFKKEVDRSNLRDYS